MTVQLWLPVTFLTRAACRAEEIERAPVVQCCFR